MAQTTMSPVRLRLKELRTALGMSQAQLAAASGVRQATISDLEGENAKGVHFDTLDRLATALGVDPALLIMRDGS